MAVERNNIVNDFGDFGDEFEAALRRHLRQVNAAERDCPQFDPELASAYAERALGAKAQARFETHLADCTVCRQHVAALYRLMPQAETVGPASAAAAVGAARAEISPERPGWFEGLKGLFDFSGWRWNAATLAGACAVVLLALALPLVWQQRGLGTAELAQSRPAPAAVATDAPAASAPETAPAEAETGEKPSGAKTDQVAAAQGETSAVPQPLVTPSVVNETMPSLPDSRRASLSGAQAGRADALSVAMPTQGPVAAQPADAQPAPAADERRQSALPVPERDEKKEVFAAIAADLDKEKSRAEAKSEESRAARTGNPAGLYIPRPTPPPQGARALREPGRASAQRTRTAPVSGSGLAAQPDFGLTKKVGNKAFRSLRGVWVDTTFDPDDKWPVIRLTRGSDEYEQTITDIPSLRQIFNSLTGPVLVLWQGTVYEVK